jgi:hypothetical protein
MAVIKRSDVIQKAVNDLAISGNDKIPNETLDKVQLTYSLNKHFSTFISGNSATATGTNTTIFPTISAGAEIYITAIDFGLIKDAACNQATGTLTITVIPADSGVATPIIEIPVITLTAQEIHGNHTLAYPLKIKPGTTGTFTASYGAGVMARSIRYTGFTTSSN